jgi:hypothetical protein
MSHVKDNHREFMRGMGMQRARKRWRHIKFWLKTEWKRPRQRSSRRLGSNAEVVTKFSVQVCRRNSFAIGYRPWRAVANILMDLRMS